jgi:hypothetical protein
MRYFANLNRYLFRNRSTIIIPPSILLSSYLKGKNANLIYGVLLVKVLFSLSSIPMDLLCT